ncbi:MAG TPA: heavy metal translocating P-type ATPase [Vicinamibacterales bacterium]|nr:heavy metal translocating P-type ATPase [Vicinamibacterales bacterium]
MGVTGQKQGRIALLALLAIAAHVALRLTPAGGARLGPVDAATAPLLLALLLGGGPLVVDLLLKLARREFGSDLLAGLSIATSVVLGEYLAGTLVVLMLSGGEALENYAVRNASSALDALARRMPTIAHRRSDGRMADVALGDVVVGDTLVVLPHEICPVDGSVVSGHGSMDESYLTGEPYVISKTPGAAVLSGAINGESALTIRAEKLAGDSRYAKIMEVMRESERRRPRLRRLGDQLGTIYTPVAITIAVAAWMASGDPVRFLAVLVVATPCPLLIAIPVAIIGSISLAARRGIIVKDPTALERVTTCRVVIFDKTGTLTYGKPRLTATVPAAGVDAVEVLALVAGLERYSKHPLAGAVLDAARAAQATPEDVTEVHERPGQGLSGIVDGRSVLVTSRQHLIAQWPSAASQLAPSSGGMECVVAVDGRYAATLQFRDEPRPDSPPFIRHLATHHRVERVLLVSGDRESEVRHLAARIGMTEIHAGQSPEQKLELVRRETRRQPTLFLGDGINDAPALTAATVGVAFGSGSDITAEAAGVVVLDTALLKVDELLHIARRMRRIALQSAVGGMALSVAGMALAFAGGLSPVEGAIAQEVIDVLAVVNALRVAWPPASLTDY